MLERVAKVVVVTTIILIFLGCNFFICLAGWDSGWPGIVMVIGFYVFMAALGYSSYREDSKLPKIDKNCPLYYRRT